MFIIEITPEARAEIAAQFARAAFADPCVMIDHQPAIGNVTRSSDGEAQWQIERPHPWRIQLFDRTPFGEELRGVSLVDGIRVWLKTVALPREVGVKVSVKDGQLFVEARDASYLDDAKPASMKNTDVDQAGRDDAGDA
jgi:hypothetical protein